MENKLLYVGLSRGENFGWGVCSKYLRKELSRRISIINIDEKPELNNVESVNGKVFVGLNNQDFFSMFKLRGSENYGYTFFENVLNFNSVRNARNYDKVIAGSVWGKEKLLENNILNADVLIQGIDPQLFYADDTSDKKDLFIIFSGGKFELRKGQDIVIKAVKHLQDKFRNVVLINSWYNMWPQTMLNMSLSKHITFSLSGNSWQEIINNILRLNGLDLSRVITLDLVDNVKLRDIYNKTSIGLFPNRCEGGTNLVLMEYMACGKPVVASFNSGHKDIVNHNNSILVEKMTELKGYNKKTRELDYEWYDPNIDEVIAKLEYAYYHRDDIKTIGKKAGEYMKNFTWSVAADNLLKIVY